MPASARRRVDRRRELPADVIRDAAGERPAIRPRRWICAGCGNQLTLGDRFCSMCGRAVE